MHSSTGLPKADASWWSSLLSASFPLKPAGYMALARQISSATPEVLPPHRRVRLAFLGNVSLQFLDPYLKVEGMRRGLLLENYFGPFGQFEQEMIVSDSGLRAQKPDILFFQISLEALDPDFIARYLKVHTSEAEVYFQNLEARLKHLALSWQDISSAPLVFFNFVPPKFGPRGIFEASDHHSLSSRILDLNRTLARWAAESPQIYILDYLGLILYHGAKDWTDPKMWYMGKLAAGASGQIALAQSISRLVSALTFAPGKCLVVDLDNTLWGGIIGDDGLAGIKLGGDFPGNAFKDFQRHLLRLRDSGVLLGINSQNDLSSAQEAFSHPEMILRWDDFCAIKVNWLSKAANMVEIAKELNISMDSLVFFDDNPLEREQMRQQCPEVRVVDVPESPAHYIETLQCCPWFDFPSLSSEDRERYRLYQEDRFRQGTRSRFTRIEDFLQDLQMTAQVGRLGADTFDRAAQLIAKTNQFNLTTRRHSLARLREMMGDPRFLILWMRVRDRFGDQGLVAIGILRHMADESAAFIDTFLMSCRVTGRKLETAFLAYLVKQASVVWGCRKIVGEFRPTSKNTPVVNFYPRHGFSLKYQGADALIYEVVEAVPFPPEITVQEVNP